MKLLSKQEVDTQKAKERKLEIDEGAKLAKRIDSLRELHSKEEKNLISFRDTNLANIRKEIDEEIKKRGSLRSQVSQAEERLEYLRKPLDREWEKVRNERLNLEDEKALIVGEWGKIKEKSNENVRISLENLTEKSRLEDERKKVLEIVKETLENREKSEKTLSESRKILSISEETARKKSQELNVRETEVAIRERDVDNFEINLKNREIELNILEKQLEDKRATLQRALQRKRP